MKGTVAERSRNLDLLRWLSRRDNLAALRAADWLSLGAAPTFVFMAAFTGILNGGAQETLCSAGSHTSALSGMGPMYLLMSVFHLAPWWKLFPTMNRRPHAPSNQ
jgi:hypothetical protein